MSITADLAEVCQGIRYEDLPRSVIDHAKWLIVDAFACALGGFHSDSGEIARNVARDLGGPPEATLIGEATRVSCSAAIIANQTMVRYLDYNDVIALPTGPGVLVACHPSGALPVVLALGERQHAPGAKVIEALVAGYEIAGRMLDSFPTSLEVRGFHHGCVLPYAAAAMSGKLLGLDKDQLVNAMGIAGSLTVALDILDAEGEDYTMTKNVADGFLSERGMLAAFLARRGLTSPERVIEGNKGLSHVLLGDAAAYKAAPERAGYWLAETRIKSLCAEGTTHGHLTAIARIVARHQLAPDDIAEIRIRTNKRTVVHTGDPVKKYPKNKETADHSSYYLSAIAVLEGRVTPKSFSPEKYADPVVRRLIDTVVLEHGPEFDRNTPSAAVTITTTAGVKHTEQVDGSELKGMPENPMGAEEIRDKFFECTEDLLPPAKVETIIESCLGLERLMDIGELMPLLEVPRPSPGTVADVGR